MKTNYPRSRIEHRALIKGFVLIVAAIVVLYLAGKPLLSFVSRVGLGAGGVISNMAEGRGSFFGTVGAYFTSRNAQEEEKRKLSDELAFARLAVIREEALILENRQLRAILGRERNDVRGILAEVVLRPPSSPYDTLVIDAGGEAGISKGDRASAHGFILGEVTRAEKKSSVVTLWSQSGRSFDVSIGEKFSGRAEGRGGGYFYIRAPRDTEIASGDIVIAPSLGDLLLGTVGAVSRDEKNPFADVYVISPENIRTIRFMEIVKKANSDE